MKKPCYVLLVCLLLLGACGGGGQSRLALLPQTAPLGSLETLESLSDSSQRPLPQHVPSNSDMLYVGNVGNNSITVYKHDVSGNSTPIYAIAGSKTDIDSPGQLSEDAAGNLYVANENSILVFAHGAHGDVAPIRRIYGLSTGLHGVTAMTVDQVTGKIFAVDYDGGAQGDGASLLRFPPNSSGNVAPFARSAPELEFSLQLTSDSTGHTLLDADAAFGAIAFGISRLPKQFSNGASISGSNTIQYMEADGIVDDPTTKTYLVSSGANGIWRLKEETTGAGDLGPYLELTPPPVSIIKNATCNGQLTLGYLRNIYTTCGDAIYVYSHDSSGNVPPLRVLKGSATKLHQPYGIYEGK